MYNYILLNHIFQRIVIVTVCGVNGPEELVKHKRRYFDECYKQTLDGSH